MPPALLDGAEFDLREDNPPLGGAPGVEDVTVASCTTVAGVCDFIAVTQGEYWVVETVAPTGHNLPATPYQHITVVADEQVSVTFVNPRQRGAILLTKTAKHKQAPGGTKPHAGVNFTIAGQSVTTDANGQACIGDLLFGQYDVIETVPAGYVAEGATTKSVTVDSEGTCASGAETVSFVNVPLTDITVSVNSQIEGATESTIDCSLSDPVTTGATGDGSLTETNLVPGTYTCTIVVDP